MYRNSHYEDLRQEIIKRYDNGNKKLLVKFVGEGVDEIVVERITFNEEGVIIKTERLDKRDWRGSKEYQTWEVREKEYNEDDELSRETITLNDGDPIIKKYLYYPNGILKSTTHYRKNGKKFSEEITYYDNSDRKSKVCYFDDKIVDSMCEYYGENERDFDGNIID